MQLADNSSVCVASAYSTSKDSEPQTMRPKYADFEDVASETNTSILASYKAHNHDIVL